MIAGQGKGCCAKAIAVMLTTCLPFFRVQEEALQAVQDLVTELQGQLQMLQADKEHFSSQVRVCVCFITVVHS